MGTPMLPLVSMLTFFAAMLIFFLTFFYWIFKDFPIRFLSLFLVLKIFVTIFVLNFFSSHFLFIKSQIVVTIRSTFLLNIFFLSNYFHQFIGNGLASTIAMVYLTVVSLFS